MNLNKDKIDEAIQKVSYYAQSTLQNDEEIIFIPAKVKLSSNGKIGSITHYESDIMSSYNSLV